VDDQRACGTGLNVPVGMLGNLIKRHERGIRPAKRGSWLISTKPSRSDKPLKSIAVCIMLGIGFDFQG